MDIPTVANNSQRIKELNFEYGFRPVYNFSRLVGLWPFSIIHHSNGSILRASVSYFDGLRFISIVCLYLTLAYFSYEKLTAIQEKNEVYISHAVSYLFQISCFLYGICAIVLDTINRNKLVNILQKFIEFDKEVGFLF